MSDGWKVLVVLLLLATAASGIILGGALEVQRRDRRPCEWGTIKTLVTTDDGRAHIVCAAPPPPPAPPPPAERACEAFVRMGVAETIACVEMGEGLSWARLRECQRLRQKALAP